VPVTSPRGPVPVKMIVSPSIEVLPPPKTVTYPIDDFPFPPSGDRPLHSSVRALNSRVEQRECPSSSVSPSLGMGASLPEPLTNLESAREVDMVGGNDPYLISGYRETEPGDCSLGETLESLVPLLREVDTTVSLSTYQGKNILTLPGSADLVDQSEYHCGGVGPSYAWSKGLGFETSPIKMRSARKKAILSVITHVPLSPTATDSGALRGMKSLARPDHDPSIFKHLRGGGDPKTGLHAQIASES
jgi:hypothetical protein